MEQDIDRKLPEPVSPSAVSRVVQLPELSFPQDGDDDIERQLISITERLLKTPSAMDSGSIKTGTNHLITMEPSLTNHLITAEESLTNHLITTEESLTNHLITMEESLTNHLVRTEPSLTNNTTQITKSESSGKAQHPLVGARQSKRSERFLLRNPSMDSESIKTGTRDNSIRTEESLTNNTTQITSLEKVQMRSESSANSFKQITSLEKVQMKLESSANSFKKTKLNTSANQLRTDSKSHSIAKTQRQPSKSSLRGLLVEISTFSNHSTTTNAHHAQPSVKELLSHGVPDDADKSPAIDYYIEEKDKGLKAGSIHLLDTSRASGNISRPSSKGLKAGSIPLLDTRASVNISRPSSDRPNSKLDAASIAIADISNTSRPSRLSVSNQDEITSPTNLLSSNSIQNSISTSISTSIRASVAQDYIDTTPASPSQEKKPKLKVKPSFLDTIKDTIKRAFSLKRRSSQHPYKTMKRPSPTTPIISILKPPRGTLHQYIDPSVLKMVEMNPKMYTYVGKKVVIATPDQDLCLVVVPENNNSRDSDTRKDVKASDNLDSTPDVKRVTINPKVIDIVGAIKAQEMGWVIGQGKAASVIMPIILPE